LLAVAVSAAVGFGIGMLLGEFGNGPKDTASASPGTAAVAGIQVESTTPAGPTASEVLATKRARAKALRAARAANAKHRRNVAIARKIAARKAARKAASKAARRRAARKPAAPVPVVRRPVTPPPAVVVRPQAPPAPPPPPPPPPSAIPFDDSG
jgi:hypothetical protein